MKGKLLYDFAYMGFLRVVRFTKMESRVVNQWLRLGNRGLVFSKYGISAGEGEKVLKIGGSDVS
jgi:hypothetical protein